MEKKPPYFSKPLKTFSDDRIIPLLCRARSPHLLRCYGVAGPGTDGVPGITDGDTASHFPGSSGEAEGPAFSEPTALFEYLEGIPFSEISRGVFPPEWWETQFDRLVLSLAWLSHAAGAPVLHGDIAPDNVMLAPGDRPVLVDFASSRMLDGACPTPLTVFSGTRSYAAPECLVAAPCPESDLFSLAMTFLSVMSGVPGKRMTARKMEKALRQIASPFQETLRRCLSPDPRTRRAAVDARWTTLVFGTAPRSAAEAPTESAGGVSETARAVTTESPAPPARDPEDLSCPPGETACPFEPSSCPFLQASEVYALWKTSDRATIKQRTVAAVEADDGIEHIRGGALCQIKHPHIQGRHSGAT